MSRKMTFTYRPMHGREITRTRTKLPLCTVIANLPLNDRRWRMRTSQPTNVKRCSEQMICRRHRPSRRSRRIWLARPKGPTCRCWPRCLQGWDCSMSLLHCPGSAVAPHARKVVNLEPLPARCGTVEPISFDEGVDHAWRTRRAAALRYQISPWRKSTLRLLLNLHALGSAVFPCAWGSAETGFA